MLLGNMNISRLKNHAQQVGCDNPRDMLRRIISLGQGTITILSRNWVVEISRRATKSIQLLLLRQQVFHPPRTGMTSRVEHKALCLRELFQAPKLTQLSLCSVRTIQKSVSQERRMLWVR